MWMRLTIAMGAALAGCVDSADHPACSASETGPVTSMLDGQVDLVAAGGLSGGGDGNALHVEPYGTVTRTTKVAGTQTFRLDTEAIDALRSQITAAQFPTLEPSYARVPDEFTYHLAVDISGTTYRVTVGTMDQLPARLSTLMTALKDLTTRPICD